MLFSVLAFVLISTVCTLFFCDRQAAFAAVLLFSCIPFIHKVEDVQFYLVGDGRF